MEDLIMKMFDYTALLNVIKEVDLEAAKLNNVKEMALKNRYLDMERKLFNSGILEDWNELNKVVTTRIFYNRFKSEKIDAIYKNYDKFFEYRDNVITILMSSGSHWSDYLYINTNDSVRNGKIVWSVFHTTNTHFFEKFRSEEEEYKLKILMIETLIDTYEEYREFALQKIAEEVSKKIAKNANVRNEINKLI
jgi:hypothetical protein